MEMTRTAPNTCEGLEDRTGQPEMPFGWEDFSYGGESICRRLLMPGILLSTLTGANGMAAPLYLYGTGPIVLDCRYTHLGVAPSLAAAITAEENIRFLSTQLGISKSDLAKVFNISRPALYAWLNGTSEPQGEHAARLNQIAGLMRMSTAGMDRPLYHGYVTAPLPGQSKALLDLLMAKNLDEHGVRSIVKQASALTIARQARLNRILPEGDGAKGLTEEVKEDILFDNLSSFDIGD